MSVRTGQGELSPAGSGGGGRRPGGSWDRPPAAAGEQEEAAERSAVHAAAASRLGAADPRQESGADLRLVPAALAAWAAARIAPAFPASVAVVVAATLVGAAAVTALTRRRSYRALPLAPAVVACALAAAAAVTCAALATAADRRGPLPALARARSTVQVALRITGDPALPRAPRGRPGLGPAVVVAAEAEKVAGTRVRTPVLVVADTPAAWLRLVPSSRVAVTARLAPPYRQPGPGDPVVVLRVHGPPRLIGGPSMTQRVAARLRAGLRKAVAPLPPDARALLPGLVVGDTSAVPQDLAEAFKATDLAHLMAVSGANLTIVLVLLTGPPGLAGRVERRGLAARLGLPLRWTACAGGALTLGFVLVCRPSPSVLRAAACGLITLLAIATGRRRTLLPALAAAVLLLVLYEPALARSYGFGLSVAATASLLVVAPRWTTVLTAHGMPPRPAAALATAAAAQAACGPLLVLHDGRLSLVAVPCNLLAEPAVGAATVLGFAALVAQPLAPGLAGVLVWLAGRPAQWIAAVARHGAALPGAQIAWPGDLYGAVLLVVVTAAAAVFGRHLLRRPLWCAVFALIVLCALLRPVRLPEPGGRWPPADWRFAMCDVGQGDALALSVGPGEAVVVDAGPDPARVDRCLRELRVTSVPLLVLTHFHADHVDGVPGVLRGRRVGVIETSVLDEPAGQAAQVRREAAAAGVREVRVSVGEEQRVGPIAWRVLWPPARPDALPDANPNDASVALLVRTGGLTLLLMGDLEPSAQEELTAETPDLPRVDVLKVAHHGSAHQDAALYARVRPRLALVSVGAGNSYGHPAARTLTVLRSLGALVLRTDVDGPIAVSGSGPADLRVSTEGGG